LDIILQNGLKLYTNALNEVANKIPFTEEELNKYNIESIIKVDNYWQQKIKENDSKIKSESEEYKCNIKEMIELKYKLLLLGVDREK